MKAVRYAKTVTVVFLALALLAALFGLTACGNAPASAVKIGVLAPLSGPFASGGKSMEQGLEMARDEINARGGISGHPVALLVEDTQGRPDVARNAALKLTGQEHVAALVGAYLSEETNAVLQVAVQSKTLLIVPISADDALTQNVAKDYDRYRYLFRVSYDIDQWAALMGDFIAGGLKDRNYAFVGTNIDWNHALAAALAGYLAPKGVACVYQQYYPLAQPAYDPVLLALQRVKPQVVVLADPGGGSVGLVKAARAQGLVIPLFSVGGALGTQAVAKSLGYGGPLYFQAAAWRGAAPADAFFTSYAQKYKSPPVGYSDVLGHDALTVLAQAMNQAGSTAPDAVIPVLEKGAFGGVAGTYRFDASHQARWGTGEGLAGVVVRWVNGQGVAARWR